MTAEPFPSVAVVGAGTMGVQLAAFLALSGRAVTLVTRPGSDPEPARADVVALLSRSVARGRIEQRSADEASDRLTVTGGLPSGAEPDLLIESITEDLAAKRALLADLGQQLPAGTVVASNSSTLVPSLLAESSGRPDRFLNLHFFNPVAAMECVEVIAGPATSESVRDQATEFVASLERTPVVLHHEVPGFIANRILYAARDEAIALVEGGVASVVDVDEACRGALGYKMGPFELMDLTGIDVGFRAKSLRFEMTGDEADRPARTVAALVGRGELGRKTGRGWYDYPQGDRSGQNPALREILDGPGA